MIEIFLGREADGNRQKPSFSIAVGIPGARCLACGLGRAKR